MSIIDTLMATGIENTRKRYERMISRVVKHYDEFGNKFTEDCDKLETLLTGHGYSIVSCDSVFAPICDDYYGPRVKIRDSDISFVMNIQKNPDAGIIQLNLKVSSAQAHMGKLYLSIKHNKPRQKKQFPVQFWIDSACCQTPFLQLFNDSPTEILDNFFLALDGLSKIKTEDDCTRYINMTCKAIKENSELLKALRKL